MSHISIGPTYGAQTPALGTANHLHGHSEYYLFGGHVRQFDSVPGIEANLHLVRGNLDLLFPGDTLHGPIEKVEVTTYRNFHRSQATVTTGFETGFQVPPNANFRRQELCRGMELEGRRLPELGSMIIQ
jgi:hypothetical protein